jgi:hypothetical protein
MAADSDSHEDEGEENPEEVVLGNGETLAHRVERIEFSSLDEKESTSTDELRDAFDL